MSKLIRTTGDALEGVGQEYYPPLKGSGDKVSANDKESTKLLQSFSFQLDEVADYLDDYHEEGVRSGYEWVKGKKNAKFSIFIFLK